MMESFSVFLHHINNPFTYKKEHLYETQHGFYRPGTSCACRCGHWDIILHESNHGHCRHYSRRFGSRLLIDERSRILPFISAAQALDDQKERCVIAAICSFSRKNCARADHSAKRVKGNWNSGVSFLPSGKPRELLLAYWFRCCTLSWSHRFRQAMSFVPLRSPSCIQNEIKVTLSNSVMH